MQTGSEHEPFNEMTKFFLSGSEKIDPANDFFAPQQTLCHR